MMRRVITIVSLVGCLALFTLPGCGSPLTDQQKAAMGHMQDLGGRINSKRGGYEVDMTNTQVQDKDLIHLKDIPNLITLDLAGTQITDASLEHLLKLDKAELIVLARTGLSNDAIEQLKKSLPKATIRR